MEAPTSATTPSRRRSVGPAGRVIAIEPIPATRAVLEQNLAVNGVAGSVSIAGAAIGAEAAGTVRLSVARGMYGMGSRATPPGTETFDVEATTLDELCRDLARISMLKLDVEGAELDALRGAGRTLSRTRAVVVECNENAREIEEPP
ncbi:MAG: FkbM family methyltransferase [Acidobacteriota bacterium]